jgi:arsenite-transporting ATPase
MRIILYTGKGGVGKTSVSAATGVRSAAFGHKTLILSTDTAHSLSDSFDREIGRDPVRIGENLHAQEIDVNTELERNWGQIQEFVVKFLKRQGFEDFMAQEFSIFPGMEELFSLLVLERYYHDASYDVAVIDCAPTGSTIRMLSFPDIIQWYMEKFFHIERRIVKAVRPVAERIARIPLPTDEVYLSIEELYLKVHAIKEILTGDENASIRLVCNPQKMVIKESQRVFTYLSLFGFCVDAIVMNRLLPAEIKDAWFGEWKTAQKRHLREAVESFQPIPIFHGTLFNREIVGMKLLAAMGEDLFGEEDPTRVFHREKPMRIEKRGGGYVLSIRLPFTEKEKIDMWVRGDELILTVGNVRRNIFLPRSLSALEVEGAKYEEGRLRVSFGSKRRRTATGPVARGGKGGGKP